MIPDCFTLAEIVAEGKKQAFNATTRFICGDTRGAAVSLQRIEVLKVCVDLTFAPLEKSIFDFAMLNQCARLRREFTHKRLP